MPKKKATAKKQNLQLVPAPTLREILVGTILAYAGDEYETKEDVVDLAMKSEDELVDRVISILDYYHDAYNQSIGKL